MAKSECERELDVLELARSGRWSERCDKDLAAHVTECAICSDLAAVADAMARDLETSMPKVSVPPSGLMWWRAQRRARQEAARVAVRAGTTIQALSVVAGMIALCVAMQTVMPAVEWRGLLARSRDMIADAATVAQFSLPLAAILAVCLAAAPVALCFAFREE